MKIGIHGLSTATITALCFVCMPLRAGEIINLYMAKSDILVLHFVEIPLYFGTMANALASTASYTIASTDDASYSSPMAPSAVKQKRKQLYNNAYTQSTYKSAAEFWFSLRLPSALKSGNNYTLSFAQGVVLAFGRADTTFRFDERDLYSEAIHVNNIGFLSDASRKFGYVSHYLGEAGGMVYSNNTRFHLMDVTNRQYVLSGTLSERTSGTGDYKVRVWQCDFSSFSTPGEYKLVVEGVGCSYPFEIGRDAYRRAFQAVCRGMFHQRCACEFRPEHTRFVRHRCHHSDDIPAYQTTSPFVNDNPQALADKATSERIDCWGGWHDAADHDHYGSHFKIPFMLFAAYELNPNGCGDGELNIPESGNGIPDILDEARWGVDLWKRLQKSDGKVPEYTTPYPSPSCIGNCTAIYASLPTNESSLLYAGMAAGMGYFLKKLGKTTLANEYITSAKRSYAVSGSGDERAMAALWLWRATGESSYHSTFVNNRPGYDAGNKSEPNALETYIAANYVLATEAHSDIVNSYKSQIVKRAESQISDIDGDAMRVRKSNDWLGGYTLPSTMALPLAYKLTGNKKYRDYHALECDYYLGGNPLNMTWITQLGEKHPTDILNNSAEHYWGPAGLGAPTGIVPFGPTAYYHAGETWCQLTANAHRTCYPDRSEWSLAELWFEWPTIVCNNEYTAHQTVGPSIFAYSALCDDQISSDWPKPDEVAVSNVDRTIRLPMASGVSIARIAHQLRVKAPEAVRVEVLDIAGRRLVQRELSTTHAISLQSFAPGPYVVMVMGSGLRHTVIVGIER